MKDIINARCGWAGTDELYIKYHDEEWGRPVSDDKTLFEFLVLESAQAGLSWLTILRKREGYRRAFHGFDVEKVARMTAEDVERLMRFDGIVKNRLKINSAVNNAKLFMAVQKEFGSFYRYVLSFFPNHQPVVNHFSALTQIPAVSPESEAMSRDMKRRGFRFFGPTICYAFSRQPGLSTTILRAVSATRPSTQIPTACPARDVDNRAGGNKRGNKAFSSIAMGLNWHFHFL